MEKSNDVVKIVDFFQHDRAGRRVSEARRLSARARSARLLSEADKEALFRDLASCLDDVMSNRRRTVLDGFGPDEAVHERSAPRLRLVRGGN